MAYSVNQKSVPMKFVATFRCKALPVACIVFPIFCTQAPDAAAASAEPSAGQVFEGPFEPDLSRKSCVPVYPEAAIRAGAVGTTVVEMVMDGAARIQRITVVKSAGYTREHKMLDRAVVHNLATCPFTRDPNVAAPDLQTITVTFDWKLH